MKSNLHDYIGFNKNANIHMIIYFEYVKNVTVNLKVN